MRSPVSPALFDQFARGWRGYVLIALIALTASQFGAGRMQVMDADEARFAQATRQMVESDDFGTARLQDQALAGPLGAHWVQAAVVQSAEPATHRLNSIWGYRLASALGIVLAAIAALWAGSALLTPRQAFFGAALFATGMLVSFQGMTATAHALALGFTTVAMAALARLYARAHPGRERWVGLLFWLALACTVLMNGFVAPVVAALTLMVLAVWERRFQWMKPLLWWPGPLLAVLIVAPWLGPIAATAFDALSPSGPSEHLMLPGFHLFVLPFLIFPATFALPAAARLSWETARAPRTDKAHAPFRFLLAWAAPFIVLLELLPSKLPHDVLPAYPAIALLCGAGLGAMFGRAWRTTHPAGVVLFAVAGVVLVALMATLATFMPGDFAADVRRAISTALIGIGIVAGAFTALIMLRRPAARAAVLVACALALSFSLRERILPEARALNVSSEAVAALTRARLTPRDDRPLWVVGYSEPSLIFLTRTSIRLASAQDAAAMAQPGEGLIVEGRAMQEVSAALEERGLTFVSTEPPVRGLAYGRGERVSLFVGQLAPVSGE